MKYHPPHEIIQENGEIYQIKRPLHKQPLFWTSVISIGFVLLLFLVIAGLVLVNFSLTEENARYGSRSTYAYNYYDYKNEHPPHYFGQIVAFRNGAKINIRSVKADPSRVMSDDAAGSAIVVSVRVTNASDRSILISPYDFDLYDEEDNLYILDGSTFDNAQIGMNLAPGKSISFDLIFDGEDGDEAAYTVVYENAKWVKQPSNKKNKG